MLALLCRVQLRLDKSDVVEFARQRALMLGVNFKVTARASVDLPADLIKIANARVHEPTSPGPQHVLV
jgi:hypothetical protein